MSHYLYDGKVYKMRQLEEMSGLKSATIRYRLRNGYTLEQALQPDPVPDSVIAFGNASHCEDWVGMKISYLHKIYSSWCIDNGYNHVTIKGFSRALHKMYPQLKVKPATNKIGKSERVVRFK